MCVGKGIELACLSFLGSVAAQVGGGYTTEEREKKRE